MNGGNDFIALKQFKLFEENERKKKFVMVPRDDDDPELDETFLVRILSHDGSVIGEKNEFNITGKGPVKIYRVPRPGFGKN